MRPKTKQQKYTLKYKCLSICLDRSFSERLEQNHRQMDNFVDQIVYDHGCFIWYLNPTYGNEVYRQETSDWEKTAAGIFR